jgi:hypothetical protein
MPTVPIDMDLLRFYFDRVAAMQQYWTFFTTVSLGLVAFFGAAARTRRSALLMTGGFLCFAAINLNALNQAGAQRREACAAVAHVEECHATQSVQKPFRIDLYQSGWLPLSAGHIVLDALTIGAIWFLALRGEKERGRQ